MSVKVHIVDGTQYDSIEVERRINEFCKGKRIIDIKYQTIFYRSSMDTYHSALIIYDGDENNCSNCKYVDVDKCDEPCTGCYDYSLWEGRK